MENQNNQLLAFGKNLLKILAGLFLFLLLVFGILLIAIRIPSVQTRAVHKASGILSERLKHQVSVESVDIAFFSDVILNKVKVLDYKNEVLFSVGRVDADLKLSSIFHPDTLNISQLTLTNPKANLIKYRGSDSLNMTTFIRALNRMLAKKDKTAKTSPFYFSIDALAIQNGQFSYDDRNKPKSKVPGIDYQHLEVDQLNVRFSGISLGDTIGVRISGLRGREINSNTLVKQLDTRMTYGPKFWEFADLTLRVGKSYLAEYIRFDFQRFNNFSYFNDSVTVTTNLRRASIYSDDVAQFAPQLRDMNEHILISGDAKGQVKRFNARNVDARYGKHTHVVGNISATGLPAIRETFMELELKPSVLHADDLKKFIPEKSYTIARRLGQVKLNGNFLGFYNDFVANGNFVTALGRVSSDLNLKINGETLASSYSGFLRTDNFQVGQLLGNTKIINSLTMSGRVKGSGFTLETARLNLDATIPAINLYGYNYRNITTNANLTSEIFDGKIEIRDPNASLTADGQVNLSKTDPSFNFLADIRNLNLKALGLTSQDIRLQTQADLDFKGLKLDEVVGRGVFNETRLTINGKLVPLAGANLISSRENGIRSLRFFSDVADLEATGTWNYTTLFRDLKVLSEEYKLNFESNEKATATYYRRKRVARNATYDLNYQLNLKKFNPVLQGFLPELQISNNSLVEGSFRQGENSIFTLTAHTDTLWYGQNEFYQNDLELNSSKLPNSPDVLANAMVTSQRQLLQRAGATNGLQVEGVWNNRSILFNTGIAQTNTNNKARINGSLAFLPSKLQVVFNESEINVLDQPWKITPANTVEISGFGKEIDFRDLVFVNKDQQISIQGQISQDPSRELQLDVKNFRLENLNPLMSNKLGGILNASANLRNVFAQPIVTSTLQADSVLMDNYLVGNVAGNTFWDNTQNRLGVDLGITRDNMKVLNVTGYYNPRSEENQLDLLAIMDEAPLKLTEPFLKTLFGDLSGTMQGRLKITGNLTSPALAGSALITNGRFNFKYLNTVYTFTDRIYFTENDITFRNVKLYDILNNTGTISGSIIHQGFKDMILDMRGDFRKLMVLNTTRENNQLYYGTAIATGSATVLGPPSNLVINIDARSEAGTRLSIPLDNNTTVTRQNFIKFVSRNQADTVAAVAEKPVDLSGINLNFNLNVTPEAYLEIILDEATGDIVRGSGNGRIKMNIDTRGEFSMEGQVEIVRGAYNFTLYNVINKEFLIRPGGTITWSGNPYEGIMNISATYSQTVPINNAILGTTTAEERGNIRIPVTAVMNLTGNLLTPQIKLDLEFTNTPSDFEAQLASYLADIRNDQDELNRQVFSLLILKRLSERGTIGSASGGAGEAVTQGITSSLSELVTNQLGNWLSQLDSNLEVDIGLQSNLNNNNVDLNNLQVRLSYSLLQGRLRVSREGGINNNANANPVPGEEINNSSLAGDWRVEYFLGRNGKYRVRMEYITTQRRFSSSNNNTNSTITNVSLLHTEQFNNLQELFRRRRLQRRYQQQTIPKLILDSDVPYDQIK